MEKISIYKYHAFGYNYRLLLSDNTGVTNSLLYKNYVEYVQMIESLKLKVTIEAFKIQNLTDEIDKLKKLSTNRKTKNEIVSKTLHDNLQNKVLKIDIVLDAELNTKIGYILDEKRHSNEILTSKINKLFNTNYFADISL